MKNMKKIAVFVVGMALCTATLAFSADLKDLQNQVSDFSGTLVKSLPFNSTLGLNWSDAFVGKFFPSLPPHFGAGFSAGFTTVDFAAFDGLLNQFGASSIPEALKLGQMMLPAYALEARIGGFFLPFDVGLKFGTLPDVGSDSASMKYTLLGGEVRYAVVDGKKNLLLPNVSVGVGVNYLSGQLTSKIGSGQSFDLPNAPTYDELRTQSTSPTLGTRTLALSDPTVGLQWETVSLDFKAQISKSLLILTPYVGFGATHAWSSAGYSVTTKLKYDGHDLVDQTVKDGINKILTNTLKVEGLDFDSDGFSSILEENGWGFRVFGGFSVNLALIRVDLTGMYNLLDSNYGITLGGRFQL
jgi:hypothetical protein